MIQKTYRVCFTLLCAVYSASVFAQETLDKNNDLQCSPQKEEVFFRAQKIAYDIDQKKYSASGNVEFNYQNKRLKANKVVFSQITQTAYAEGRVTLYDDLSESYLYADKINLNQDMSLGFAEMVYAQNNETLKIAAERVIRKSDTITEFHNAVYTPCHFKERVNHLYGNFVHKKLLMIVLPRMCLIKMCNLKFLKSPFLHFQILHIRAPMLKGALAG